MLKFFKIAVLSVVLFALPISGVFALQGGNMMRGVQLSLAAGGTVGLLLAGFVSRERSRFQAQNPCREGERLLKQGPANHFQGLEGVGGWLYLTDQRLLFRSHRFNIHPHELAIALEEVREVDTCTIGWIVPNGLRVVSPDGPEGFAVEGRRTWVAEIKEARDKAAKLQDTKLSQSTR